jgi:hypothetical protein
MRDLAGSVHCVSVTVYEALKRHGQPVLKGVEVVEVASQEAPAVGNAEHQRVDGGRPGAGLGRAEAVTAQALGYGLQEVGVEEAGQCLGRLGPFAGGALEDEQRVFLGEPRPAPDDALGETLHLTNVSPRHRFFIDPVALPADAAAYLDYAAQWARAEGGYIAEQSTRPNTLAVGLGDSPAGLLAWITEKLIGWSDTSGGIDTGFSPDEILTWVSAYWLTNTIGTSFAAYVEGAKPADHVETPTIVSAFAHDILPAPRSYAEVFVNVHDFVEHSAGGHFAAWEQPEAYAADLGRAVRLGSVPSGR